jgi:flagella basal body P-ring formation protein FlgA
MKGNRRSAITRPTSVAVLAFFTLIAVSGLLAAEEISITSVQAATEAYLHSALSHTGPVTVGEIRIPELGDLEGRNLAIRPRLHRPPDTRGPVLVSLEFWRGEERVGQRTASVDVQVFQDVLVTTRGLDRHALIDPDDIRVEKVDVRTLGDACFTEVEDLVGRWTRKIIPEGRAILARDVEDVPLIKRGQKILIIVHLGGITVRATGQALEDGAAGDEIAVKNERSGKRLNGVVVGEGRVEVRLATRS